MAISLTKFVDINIVPKVTVTANATRDTVLLFSNEKPTADAVDDSVETYDSLDGFETAHPYSDTVKCISILRTSADDDNINIKSGGSIKLTAEVFPNASSGVYWYVSSNTNTDIVTVTQDGLVRVISGNQNDEFTVTCASTSNEGISDSVTFTIVDSGETLQSSLTKTSTAFNNSKASNEDALKNTRAYVTEYFANAGKKVEIHYLVKSPMTAQMIFEELQKVDYTRILVAVASSDEEPFSFDSAKALATMIDSSTTKSGESYPSGIYRKILLWRVTLDDIKSGDDGVGNPIFKSTDTVGTLGIKSMVVMYSTVVGAEMAIAGYLADIQFYGSSTVKDICYTTTSTLADSGDNEINDTIYDRLQILHYNCIYPLGGTNRIIGGDNTSGLSLVNDYSLIVCHQTLTENLTQLLSYKLSGSTGMSRILATLTEELQNYVTNGYLVPGKVWNDPTLTIAYNGQTFTVITQGTQVLKGFIVYAIPYYAISDTDRAAHKTTPIYVILSTSDGIRQISVDGTAI